MPYSSYTDSRLANHADTEISPPPVHTAGIVLKRGKKDLASVLMGAITSLRQCGIRPIVEAGSALDLSVGCCECMGFEDMCVASDILLSIGGDGTLISVVRRSYAYRIPVLGIHLGRLGFLTTALPDQMGDLAPRLKNSDYHVYSHMMLKGESRGSGEVVIMHSLNEFLFSKSSLDGMIEIDVYANNMLVNKYRLDSLIVSTPTGSSAYNISAGGSVVYPYCRNILLTPVCAHSLTQRPLILNDEFTLTFRMISDDVILICDGQEKLSLSCGDEFIIKAASNSALLAQIKKDYYFERLRDKFSWGK